MAAIRVGYQIALVGVAYFLLVSAPAISLKIHVVWMIQGVAGMALLLAWSVWGTLETD